MTFFSFIPGFLTLAMVLFLPPLYPAENNRTIAQETDSSTIQYERTMGHEIWDGLLKAHVNTEGIVNYAGFQQDHQRLQLYLDRLAAHPPQSDWPRNEQMAYWINAYNAFTIKLILDHYPVGSIMDIHQGKAWDVKWIKLGTQIYTLNNIENDILRPRFGDARIHFALNCAARSCPPLLNRAFTATELDQQLDRQAKNFINNPSYNKISSGRLQVSKIFEWYAKDFGNLISFLNRYSTTRINPGAQVTYLEYDWALNGK